MLADIGQYNTQGTRKTEREPEDDFEFGCGWREVAPIRHRIKEQGNIFETQIESTELLQLETRLLITDAMPTFFPYPDRTAFLSPCDFEQDRLAPFLYTSSCVLYNPLFLITPHTYHTYVRNRANTKRISQ